MNIKNGLLNKINIKNEKENMMSMLAKPKALPFSLWNSFKPVSIYFDFINSILFSWFC